MAFLYDTINSRDILETLHKDIKSKYPTRLNVSEFTLIGGRRIDMLSLDYMGGEVRGYEIKTSRSDFLGDKKWKEYLEYCGKFYFVCPAGMIKPEELDKEIGLIYIDKGHIQERYAGDEIIRKGISCFRSRIVKNAKTLPKPLKPKFDYILKRLVFRIMDLQRLSQKTYYKDSFEQNYYDGILDIHGNQKQNGSDD